MEQPLVCMNSFHVFIKNITSDEFGLASTNRLNFLFPIFSLAVFFCIVFFAIFVYYKDAGLIRLAIRQKSMTFLNMIGVMLFLIAAVAFQMIGPAKYPCAANAFLPLLIVPCFGTVVVSRLAVFILSAKFSKSTQTHGRLHMNDEDDADSDSNKNFSKVAALFSAIAAVLRPNHAMGLTDQQGVDARMQELYTLRFLVSTQGAVGIFAFVSFPFFCVALAFLLADKAHLSGCFGCVLSFDQAGIIIAEAAIFLILMFLVNHKMHGLADPFGLQSEIKWSMRFWALALLGFGLTAFIRLSHDMAYDHMVISVFGFMGQFAVATVLQVWLGRKVPGAYSVRGKLKRAIPSRTLQPESSQIGGSKGDDVKRTARVESNTQPPSTLRLGSNMVASNGVAEGSAIDVPSAVELSAIISHPVWGLLFEDLLVAEHGFESLLFLRDTANWKRSYFDIAASARAARARRIGKQFIRSDGVFTVNVSSHVHRDTLRALECEDVAQTVFDSARFEIAGMLEFGAAMRFKMSPAYLKDDARAALVNAVL